MPTTNARTEIASLEVVHFIQKLIDFMDGNMWGIESIVEITVCEENGKTIAKIEGDEHIYERQDDHFICQTCGYLGDDYSGFMLIPMDGVKYLKISFCC